MGVTTTTPLMTFEEFERLPNTIGKRELLEGEPIELPVPEFSHSTNAEELFIRLRTELKAAHARGEATDLGAAHVEAGYRLSSRSFVRPDVSITHSEQVVQR